MENAVVLTPKKSKERAKLLAIILGTIIGLVLMVVALQSFTDGGNPFTFIFVAIPLGGVVLFLVKKKRVSSDMDVNDTVNFVADSEHKRWGMKMVLDCTPQNTVVKQGGVNEVYVHFKDICYTYTVDIVDKVIKERRPGETIDNVMKEKETSKIAMKLADQGFVDKSKRDALAKLGLTEE